MISETEILDAYLFLREHNHDISDETLDFMKNVSLRELESINRNHANNQTPKSIFKKI